MSVPDQTPSAQKKYDNAKQLKEEAGNKIYQSSNSFR